MSSAGSTSAARVRTSQPPADPKHKRRRNRGSVTILAQAILVQDLLCRLLSSVTHITQPVWGRWIVIDLPEVCAVVACNGDAWWAGGFNGSCCSNGNGRSPMGASGNGNSSQFIGSQVSGNSGSGSHFENCWGITVLKPMLHPVRSNHKVDNLALLCKVLNNSGALLVEQQLMLWLSGGCI